MQARPEHIFTNWGGNMAEVSPSTTIDIVNINGTYGDPKNFNRMRDHTVTITRDTDDKISTVTASMNSIDREKLAITRSDGKISSATKTLYQTDGTTTEREATDTVTRTDGKISSMARVVST